MEAGVPEKDVKIPHGAPWRQSQRQQAKEGGQPLEAGNGRETGFLWSLQKELSSADTLTFELLISRTLR